MNQPKNLPQPSPPMHDVEQLLWCYQRGDYEAAVVLARSLTQSAPQFQFAWKAYGSILKLMNRLEECVAPMQEAVRLDPGDAEAHNNLGDALTCRGDYVQAEAACREAVRLEPAYALAHSNLGNVLLRRDLPLQAQAAYAEAIRLEPQFSQAHFNMGHLHELQGRPAEAEGSYREAIRLESGYVEAHTNLGHLLASQGRLTAAEVSCREALRLDPANALAHNNLGLVMLKLDRYAEAEACFRHAIRIDPYLHRAHNNLGNTLLNGPQRREEALACYDRALELAPGSAEVWTNRGLALSQAQRHWEALASHDRAIELEPDYAQAWNNRGKTLNDLKRYDESLCNHDRSIALKPGYAEAWLNRGNTLKDLRRYEEAVTSYEQAIKEEPNYAEAHYNKGLLQLEKRDFSAGFKNYLQRWRTKSFSSPPIRTHLSPWRPGLPSEKILLWGEQGLGDEIFYARMLRRALGQGSDFTLAADQRLHQIFKRSFPNIKLVDRGEVDNGVVDADFDAQAPMGDLGYLLQFDPTKTESVRQPFLLPDPEKSAEFKADQGFGSGKLVCGISWRSANKESGTDKSIRLTDLEPVLSNPNLTLVNLQYGDVDAEIEKFSALGNRHIRQFKGLDIYKDIDSLLSLIDACDLIVTTSNVTAHLAGAIGKKGCVIVPHAKGRIWYWHLDDIVSTWYPSLRVFYQEDPYNWSGAIRQAAQWVEDCCRST